jgi:hypothetical protein
MATEGRRYTGKKNPGLMRRFEIDEELTDIRAEMEKLAFRMQHNTRSIWVYEWPMRKPKVNWPVKQLMVKRQQKLLKGWLRHAENLNGPKQMVQVCELEAKRNLSDAEDEMGSVEDLKHCQEGREEILDCQVGKEFGSAEDLTDCHEDSHGISQYHVGNGSRSLRDIMDCQEGSREFSIFQVGMRTEMGSVDSIDCQEGSRKIPYFQVGRDEQMRLSESLIDSEVRMDQQMQLTEEEDLRNLQMIGGIQVFLPHILEEVEIGIAEAATTEVG